MLLTNKINCCNMKLRSATNVRKGGGKVKAKKQVALALGSQEQRALFRKLVNMNFN